MQTNLSIPITSNSMFESIKNELLLTPNSIVSPCYSTYNYSYDEFLPSSCKMQNLNSNSDNQYQLNSETYSDFLTNTPDSMFEYCNQENNYFCFEPEAIAKFQESFQQNDDVINCAPYYGESDYFSYDGESDCSLAENLDPWISCFKLVSDSDSCVKKEKNSDLCEMRPLPKFKTLKGLTSKQDNSKEIPTQESFNNTDVSYLELETKTSNAVSQIQTVPQLKKDSNQTNTAYNYCAKKSIKRKTEFTFEDENPLYCQWTDCQLKFPNQKSLVEHIEKKHVEGNKRGDEFTCYWNDCVRQQKPFNARYKLLIHMRVHSGEKPNKCPVSCLFFVFNYVNFCCL